MSAQTPGGFDFPAEMRALAEKSVEQARIAFDSFISAAQQTATTVQVRAETAQTGAREVGELALRYAEENIAASFEFAQKLMTAKDAKDVAAMHADYVKRQITALSDQASELSKRSRRLTS